MESRIFRGMHKEKNLAGETVGENFAITKSDGALFVDIPIQ